MGLAAASAAGAGQWARNDEGWTVFKPSEDTRQVYVSQSVGDDDNAGLSPQQPVKTIQRGYTLLRNNSPDHLLLKRGDTWTNTNLSAPHNIWQLQGRSIEQPMVIGAYGSGPRPHIKTGDAPGIQLRGPEVNSYSNLAITDLHLEAHTYDGRDHASGIRLLRPGKNLLVENMEIENYENDLVFRPVDENRTVNNVQIRRNVIHDAFALNSDVPQGSNSQGAFFKRLDGLRIEGNVFDHNGWNEQVPGADPTVFNQTIYIQTDNKNVSVRKNIIARAAAHGLQARSGGEVINNFFVDNSLAFLLRGKGKAAHNVVASGSLKRVQKPPRPLFDEIFGFGIDMQNSAKGKMIRNLVVNTPNAPRKDRVLYGLEGVYKKGNIVYQWAGQSDEGPYPNPGRTIEMYNKLVGGKASLEAFIQKALQQSKQNWDEDYTAAAVNEYFRNGFGVVPPTPEPTTLLLLAAGGGLMLAGRRRGESRR